MPTGYTADVQDGKITEFADFAMACARAFGACVTMRDDPSSASIPEQFAPSDYSAKALKKATADLAELEAMTPDDRQSAADMANAEAVKSWDDYEAKKAVRAARYEAMLVKVRDWTPPTSEHNGMKEFMVQQLTESIRFDCGEPYSKRPEPKSVDDWFATALAEANRSVSFYAKAQAEEIERARQRTKWVADLRASLLPKNEAA